MKFNFPQVTSVLPTTVSGSPCLYLDPWAFPSYFLPSSCWTRETEWLGGSLAASQGHPITDNFLMSEGNNSLAKQISNNCLETDSWSHVP